MLPPTFEHHREPFGIGEHSPRLSWKTVAETGWTQTAYEIEISRASGVVRSGALRSTEQILVPWIAEPLSSREIASVRVRVWGDASTPSPWSAPSDIEAGLLSPDDWSAQPVGATWEDLGSKDDRRPPLLRRGFTLDGPIAKARLYVTAHGVYECEINGSRVGEDVLNPGWTVYDHRLRYQTYDVGHLLKDGANALGAWMGDGWYRGRLGFHGGYHDLYGTDLSLLAQLEVHFEDGRRVTVATDGSWRAETGPIISTGLLDGEVYDAREERASWSEGSYDDGGWEPVGVRHRDAATLIAPDAPPVRCTEERTPVEVIRTPSGRTVLDFGQNLVGRLRLDIDEAADTVITIRTAEVMQDGELYTRTLRGAKATDRFISAGRRQEFEPRFTIHGFRYAEVDGWTGSVEDAVADGRITARVHHTDMERTGWFESSNPLINRLHENVVWSMRGNFVDIPTDCPQRDERLGWTGDIQVFAPTASFLFDCSGMLAGWLKDVALEQLPDGTVPWFVPTIPGGPEWTPPRPGAVWGDVAVLTPWTLWERFGDAGVLREQYVSAKAWVDLVARLAGPDRLWNEGFQLGDWLDPSAPPEDPTASTTDPYLVATAYFARSAERLADTAEVLGEHEDSQYYRLLAEEVRAAFTREYFNGAGVLTSDSQTAYALAIMFDLSDPIDPASGERLAELITEGLNRISTGFAGTNLVSDALTRTGHVDKAYDLLFEESCPSWLYTVLQGGTTIWERWDSLQPDGTVNPGGMTSFNHYALGAVADWLHRFVAGLAPAEPGYRRIEFRPHLDARLESASARHETPYGLAGIQWSISGGIMTINTQVPTGSTGTLHAPNGLVVELSSGSQVQTVISL